jgi:ADP-ribose pyrophosphatase YjhB (NUDIX family)
MLTEQRIKHCPQCGHTVHYLVPQGDNRNRAVCPQCQHIEYENPRNVVGTLPIWGDQVLLCLRNIEPRYGKWTLPAGFMEMHETLAEGAMRETHEEAGAQIELQDLYSIMNVTRVAQVHFFYRARLLSAHFHPGEETQIARLFQEEEIPWDELAFTTVKETLKHYFSDRRAGTFSLHTQDV